ncbi:hypothetical protein GT755_04025 [Herbidospora sp. NEAU-GS84]|uniref:Uncharacterized protein n=1 Tax=Herbidospora solisilvae TaxID=2696284 RepID=A0A7C9MUV6_9ACTN|nr:hypothetical protein [Herbidospora solisilvae]NAS20851.1 hypothetical protein [Herbidospora solisilvae]
MRRNLLIYQGPGAPPTPEGWHAAKVTHHDPRSLCRWIDVNWDGGRIALVAHGTAGLVFRHAYLVANGDDDSREHRPWAGHVSRMVLLAVPNRGAGLGRFRRGGPYVTDLRVRWVDHFDRTTDPVKVVQVNGPSASRDDCVDVEQFPNARLVPTPDVFDNRVILEAVLGRFQPTTPPSRPAPQPAEFLLTSYTRLSTFLDEYAQTYALHRHAGLTVTAVEGGARTLAKALDRVPSLRFDTVRLDRPALSPDFPWHRVIEREQAGHITCT